MKYFFLFLLLTYTLATYTQIRPRIPKGMQIGKNSQINENDSIDRKKIKIYPPDHYKIFTVQLDTIAVDTCLTIRTYYAFNELLQDDFLYLPFQNYGQAVTPLSFLKTTENIFPEFVATTKLTDYWTHEQVPFFKTPTPYSDLTYINGITQGQMLRAVFATNVTPQLNIAAGYRGLSSQGLYKHSISSSGRFFGSLNYTSKSDKYRLKFYYFTYEKTNEENGGIKYPEQFENGEEDFKDRGRIEVNLNDAENQLKKRRLFAGQEYDLLHKNMAIFNEATYRYHYYQYTQNTPSPVIDTAFTSGKIKDSTLLKSFDNYGGISYKNKILQLKTGLRYTYQKYSMDSIKVIQGQVIPNQLTYNDLSLSASTKLDLNKLILSGKLDIGITENITGYLLKAQATYRLPQQFVLKANFKSLSKKPDFKYILYQSAYQKFNWYHPEFDNVWTQALSASIQHPKWGKLKVDQQIVTNYTYFGQDSLPHQNATGIAYSGLQYQKDIYYKKWGLATDLKLQKVIEGADLLSLPSYVIRSSLFYTNHYYNRNLKVQTGFTVKYFEAYTAPAYNPVLSEFVLQNQQKIGGYPILDYFINFKIKRFRMFIKLEHFNALWESKNPTYYVAPLQPYRDFSVRFGLRWIFFN